jgi:REP element-mobilizing transposase RayT
VFTERWIVTDVTAQLFQSAALFECGVLAYCVMPDHLHVLIEAQSDRSDFAALMKGFTHARRSLWQPGHRERVLRDDEESDAVARYILENPVRAGLSRTVGDYPFAWSDVYDLASFIEDGHARRYHQVNRRIVESPNDSIASRPWASRRCR